MEKGFLCKCSSKKNVIILKGVFSSKSYHEDGNAYIHVNLCPLEGKRFKDNYYEIHFASQEKNEIIVNGN